MGSMRALAQMFVIGHDCGHRSFSKNRLLEDIVGTLMFMPLIYPFEPCASSTTTTTRTPTSAHLPPPCSAHPLAKSLPACHMGDACAFACCPWKQDDMQCPGALFWSVTEGCKVC